MVIVEMPLLTLQREVQNLDALDDGDNDFIEGAKAALKWVMDGVESPAEIASIDGHGGNSVN